ncbi:MULTISPECIES: keywimysin-related RiPP [Streptomyces]|nr:MULTISPECIES: keywimysin-related RiPP [Streptomyces]MCX4502919.1 keywimysin-related RiPP [Streptomyces anulatus]WTE29124.1 keywimysin-related RiPP [Streptomyces anulatus]
MVKKAYETPEFVSAGSFHAVTGWVYIIGNDGTGRGWL